jgi:endonuclease/exonuclease/phosphatase family metal-dependent hydrolase
LRKFAKYILLFINAIAIGGLIVSYVSLYFPPDKGWLISLAGMAYPWILLGNILLMMFWLFTKPKFILLSLLTILLGFNVASRYFQLSGRTTEDEGIKVVSYNVKHFTGTGRNPSKDLADLIKGFLKETEPDIICLQEVKLRSNHIFNLQAAKSEFPSIRHYQYARASGTGGSVTLTRFPIVKMQEIRFENSGNIAICTDVVANNDTIRIFNIHLQSYRIDPDKYRIIGRQRITDEKDLEEVKELGMKYRDAVKMRAKQARVIHEKISSSPYPVIVCGDFNDPPSSYSYQKVRGDLVDSFVDSGRGIGRTYVGKLPSFRIDYILHSDTFDSYNFKVYDVPYSDHLPVACELIRN